MKKIFGLLTTFLLLSNCVESMALLGPVYTAAGSGNIAQSAVSSAVSYGVKQQTGKSPTEHAISYVKANNPSNKKEKCIDFIESTNSEACAAINKNIAEIKDKIIKKSKIENLAFNSIQTRPR
mgnify:CR=1 FL=1|jgi:hypothetical protein